MNCSPSLFPKVALSAFAIPAAFASFLFATPAIAQDPAAQEKLQAIQKAQAADKQKLAQYTWQETEAISIKGQDKDSRVYQVRIGPDGQQQKTEIVEDAEVSDPRHQGRLEKHLAKDKSQEYKEYGQQISALAKQYTTPNPDLLTKAAQQGKVSIQSSNGIANLVIKDYLKPGDSVTMMIDDQTHSPVSVQIKSYLSDQKDAVNISAEFGKLPDGLSHVVNATIQGVSKQLTINDQNANYKKL
jgi:hypothetical protein